jgi:hypothetical protein
MQHPRLSTVLPPSRALQVTRGGTAGAARLLDEALESIQVLAISGADPPVPVR